MTPTEQEVFDEIKANYEARIKELEEENKRLIVKAVSIQVELDYYKQK